MEIRQLGQAVEQIPARGVQEQLALGQFQLALDVDAQPRYYKPFAPRRCVRLAAGDVVFGYLLAQDGPQRLRDRTLQPLGQRRGDLAAQLHLDVAGRQLTNLDRSLFFGG